MATNNNTQDLYKSLLHQLGYTPQEYAQLQIKSRQQRQAAQRQYLTYFNQNAFTQTPQVDKDKDKIRKEGIEGVKNQLVALKIIEKDKKDEISAETIENQRRKLEEKLLYLYLEEYTNND